MYTFRIENERIVNSIWFDFFTEPLEWEDFEEEEDVVDLRANDIVGGVFHFDLMSLPPQPKTMNKWIVTRCKEFI